MTARTRRLLRVLRRRLSSVDQPGPPATPPRRTPSPWERFSTLTAAADPSLVVDDPATAQRAWRRRPPAAATYLHQVDPTPTTGMRERVDQLRAGSFTPHTSVPARDEALPPGWDARSDTRRTEEMYRHSLRWLEPVVAVAHADDDAQLWQLVRDVVTSWITGNAAPPWRSPGAWHDHAVSIRVRILCWVFELSRRRDDIDAAWLRLLVASIHQHGLYLADDATYAPRSNHALEANGSLLAVCVTVPELRAADAWDRIALRRLDHYTANAFTDTGFSKEQSPRYHFFILRRLAALVTYLGAVDHPVPDGVRRRLDQATRVWPWLVRDDGTMPRVGDTNDPAIGHWRQALAATIDQDPPPPAPSSVPNPRGDAAALLVDFDAGYAVLRGAPPGEVGDDTHVLFKCNYFHFPHFHHDGLSFVLYAQGREWLLDPGPHSYEYDRWERRYLVSSSAHNVVEVDGPFELRPVELVDVTRNAGGDRVTVRHRLGPADHTRTVVHLPGSAGHTRVRVTDVVDVTDGGRHDVRQLFHVHPDCDVEVEGRRVVLTVSDGRRCTIVQHGDDGAWSVVRGRREPTPLGWYSPRSLAMEPVSTCVWSLDGVTGARLETAIDVTAAAPVGSIAAGNSTDMPTDTRPDPPAG